MTKTRFRYRNSNGLRFLQVNVGRGGPTHDIALNLAHEGKADFIAIQEPWFKNDTNRPLTKSHPAFRTFLPRPDNSSRPRVACYIRKASYIRANMTNTGQSTDFCSLHLRFADNWSLDIWNVYNAPVGSQDAG